ncbi:MAG: HAMP domain-containing histidine kinase [Clostridia bacterium]|nr:HAMP domain-containing histidine kinase [Clostridia bacterium]
MTGKTRRKPLFPKGVSICWKLGSYLFALLAILLVILFGSQVLLSDLFFEHIQKQEMQRMGNELAQSIEQPNLELLAYDAAVDSAASVIIYRMEKNASEATQIVKVDLLGDTEVFFRADLVNEYYRKAVRNNGSYIGKFTMGGYEVEEDFWDLFYPNSYIKKDDLRLIYIDLVIGVDGAHYVMLISSALLPMQSMARTWEVQFVIISILMLVAVSVMVYLLYRKISKPLIQMNEAAKQLALGKYDVEFSGQGYRETRELANTLNYASNELSKLDRLQKELIANISHDLRTPLTMIRGYGEVMRDLPGENTPENMQIVIDETSRLSELVDDLLDLSRIQSGTRKAEMSVFSITSLLSEVMERYDAFTHHKGYRIDFHCNQDVLIYADRSMVLQVLYNLINNAINYTGSDLLVVVHQAVSDGRVRISVTDTGEGIAPEQMPLIWDRYYKEDKVHRRALIGTGLGLSIVKEILELHGFAYGVNSTVGKGSTFWFEFDEYTEQPSRALHEQTDI